MTLIEPRIPISDAAILKMDTIANKATIRYKLSAVEPSCGDIILSLYHMTYGYPVSVAEWDIVANEDEVKINLQENPLPKADYYVKIKGMIPDEKADQKEIAIHDLRVSDSKSAKVVIFDPAVKKVAVPEAVKEIEAIE